MGFGTVENQLELFDVTHQPASHVHREFPGCMVIRLRHDQLLLSGIASLIGLAMIFACGVERGKQLVRSEHVMLARPQPATEATPIQARPVTVSPAKRDAEASMGLSPAEAARPAPTAPQTPKAPSKLASSGKGTLRVGASRYAIQVVTYSRPQLAKQELQRLQARGERAFLVIRNGRTAVYVGPFPSKGHASEHLARVRRRYQDCFVKTL